jgi:hypothetical protein
MRRAGPAILFALVAWHLVTLPTLQRELLRRGAIAAISAPDRGPMFWLHLAGLATVLWVLPWTLAGVGAARPRAIAAFAGVFAWLHAPFGLYGPLPVRINVVQPAARLRLDGGSPALERLRAATPVGRAVGIESALFPGYTGLVGLEGISGPSALRNPSYEDLLAAAGVEQVWYWRHIIHTPVTPEIRRCLDALNVSHYAAMPGTIPRGAGSGLVPEVRADLEVYRSPTAWPRAFFVDEIRSIDSATAFVAALQTGDGRPFAAMASSDLAALPRRLMGRRSSGARRIVASSDNVLMSNATAFTIDAPAEGVAVLTEAWVPDDLTATVNGAPVPCVRVNQAFRGIVIPGPGRWRVAVAYRPRGFDAALVVAGAGCSVLAIWVLVAGLVMPRGARAKRSEEG